METTRFYNYDSPLTKFRPTTVISHWKTNVIQGQQNSENKNLPNPLWSAKGEIKKEKRNIIPQQRRHI